MTLYVRHLSKHVEATKKWVAESRDRYNTSMRAQANKRGKTQRTFKLGDSVRLQEVPKQGVMHRKLMRSYDGPYQILEKVDDNEYTIQKLGEGTKIKLRVHADRLAPYNDLMELDVRQPQQQA